MQHSIQNLVFSLLYAFFITVILNPNIHYFYFDLTFVIVIVAYVLGLRRDKITSLKLYVLLLSRSPWNSSAALCGLSLSPTRVSQHGFSRSSAVFQTVASPTETQRRENKHWYIYVGRCGTVTAMYMYNIAIIRRCSVEQDIPILVG